MVLSWTWQNFYVLLPVDSFSFLSNPLMWFDKGEHGSSGCEFFRCIYLSVVDLNTLIQHNPNAEESTSVPAVASLVWWVSTRSLLFSVLCFRTRHFLNSKLHNLKIIVVFSYMHIPTVKTLTLLRGQCLLWKILVASFECRSFCNVCAFNSRSGSMWLIAERKRLCSKTFWSVWWWWF